ncbi:MAG TPA: hypothetical protein VFU21_28300 [Kofleriaceae bacterium]|nr:hypothetical protein [Kofleriaceae bacterium]
MTTLEELLTMMAEDAAKQVPPEKRPPPLPPKKAEAIGSDEIESLDDGPVLTSERLWPSALPKPARRGPPPPPPGRRARGTSPLSPDNVTSGLIDVRAMALAYEQQARAEAAAPEPVADDIIKIAIPVAEPPAAEPPAAEPEPETPKPVMAEGTRPFPAVEEEAAAEPQPEAAAAPAEKREKRAIAWPVVARRAAVVLLLGGVAALAFTFVANRVRSDGAAAEPTDYTARVAPREPAPLPAEVVAPAAAEVEVPVEPVVVVQPTTITEVAGEVASETAPIEEVSPSPAEVAEPAIARNDEAAVDESAGPGQPPPELLADGCFDAACATTAPRVRRPAPPPAEVTMMPARLSTRPSASEIASAIFSAQDQIDGCGDIYGTTGAVPLKIRIAPSGAITSVAVGEGTTRFRTCVADIVRRVRMPASVVGTTASFPVLVR